MNYRNILIIFLIFFLLSCEQYNPNKDFNNFKISAKYKNSGFALVYTNDLENKKSISKKIDNRSLLIFHKKLKKKIFCKNNKPNKPKNGNSKSYIK